MRRLIAAAGVLAGTIVFAPAPADAGGGCHGSGQSSGAGTTVELAMNCMNPRVLRAAEGTAVTFVNRDRIIHNLFGDGWAVEELPFEQTYTREFVKGTHVFSCTLHPGMVGAIVVGDGIGAPIANVTPVRQVAASTTSEKDDTTTDRLPLGLAIGAVAGVAASVGVRRLKVQSPTA